MLIAFSVTTEPKQRLQQSFHPDREVKIPSIMQGRKRQRHPSSDSSLLDLAPRITLFPCEDGRPIGQVQEALLHCQKRHEAEPLDSVKLNKSNYCKETFENQAQHKTQEEYFQAIMGMKSGYKADKEKPSKKKPRTIASRKTAAEKAAKDVMNNFTSKHIFQERLKVGILASFLRVRGLITFRFVSLRSLDL
jgi:hypothetical protein